MEKSHAKRKSVKSSIELIILLITLSTSPVKTFGTVVKGETDVQNKLPGLMPIALRPDEWI